MMDMMDFSPKIGFIGAGNMAQAIGISVIKNGLFSPDQVYVSAPSKRNFKVWDDLKVRTTHHNLDLCTRCDVVFLTMKPQFVDEALAPCHPTHQNSKLFVSVIAGLSFSTLYSKIGQGHRLIRVMPNIALQVGEGCSVICPDERASEADVDLITRIMASGGTCDVVPESLMNALCALCGSGLGFGFSIIEALSDGAVKQGIPRALSFKLAAQTMLGAAKMVLDTGVHPAALRDNVCSPGGTTIHGIHALEKGNLRSSLMSAIEASTNRGFELAKGE